ncbi:beta-ketoacyl-ACP synthase III [Coxiella burnetii]|uniref:Beta-ketoacyl-[acyl-carrier-protein] synthase III n=1 Tax=Coxiella burnetii (strain CbuK_Q154) TaxID=434924 RepID=FABH_COXB1|nr:beta-ketoacyl-ACP synthase III [Coxiella burnetii]B6J8E5.1 RecName: Full=Beta-ketoacyl-[acyl-carrier-protein] synthase III; Short=Beta-ketoacyl-ACP synthase III; Short=KAS III; AltName: Full=3-oxoacyl-[acyl-carrier-protein] synthase 3; AltName: Full=3-oxoacyl-[acyl-carrier-protein] synthase III [Coxiella burnetii CbuK_Q154]ACJ20544.1 3-oxoacyl-[acyl-carrier-protein] synthase III [Coxiella burnetii CbuK_Q154]ATN86166.1 3-oxoacyl-ACP synthase [Coxiella burnetii str. Schperling]EAX31844.1 3-oxo
MTYARIQGVGSYIPQQILSNADLEKMVNTTDEWIMQRVGVRERHVIANSPDNTTTMAVDAAKRAIEMAGIDSAVIDMIIVGTATAEYYFPSTACLVQKHLNLREDIPAFDINAACAGFVYALSIADQYIRNGGAKHILVIGVDSLTKVVDWKDRSTCILFGDGAGAVILQAHKEPGILNTILHANGDYSDLITAKSGVWERESVPHLHMYGKEVFKLAVTKLGEIVDEIIEKSGLKQSDIDWLIPHQANLRIIEATAKRLGLPRERVILTIEQHGNTSAASIPLALDAAVRAGKIKRGDTLLLEAFGAGLAWGAALLKL